jgi:hypothetical protein
MQFSLFTYYFIHLTSKYFSQFPVLTHSYSTLFPKHELPDATHIKYYRKN